MRLKHLASAIFTCQFFLSALSFAAGGAKAKAIEDADRSCITDLDCVIVKLACACIHNSTCERAGDIEAGFVDSISKSREFKFKALSSCTASEQKSCTEAGACPHQGNWRARCESSKCSPIFDSVSH